MRFASQTVRSSLLTALMFLFAGAASAASFQFTAGSVTNTVTEGGPALVLTIERLGGSSGSRTVTYSVSGTASSGSDFTLAPASVNFSNGQTSSTITVTLPEDLVQESTETLIITLTGVNGGDTIGTNNTATINILDNDGPGIEINNVALTEGNSGTVVMAFTVQLSATSTQDVMVNFATQNDTAIAPGDYAATSGTLTIPAGQQLGIINVSIMSNTVDQIDRSFFVNLSSPVNGNIVDGQGVGTILDDDGPTVSVGDASVTEGNSGTANMSFTVSLSAPSPQQITVQYFTTDDTANAGTDYQFRSGILTFAPGVTTQTVLVPIIGDTAVEANEQFFVDLFNFNEAFPGDIQGVGTITNDDVAGVTVTAAPNLQTTEAGGTATFSIALTSTPSSDVTISITSSDLTEGTVSTSMLTFTPANALTPQVVTITGVNDIIRDGDIAYTIITGNAVSADSNYNGQVIADVAVTNLDNEADPAVTLSLANSPMPENGGTATVTATLSLESTVDVTVALGFTGTGTLNTDYGVNASSIVIPAGSLTGSIVISAIDDLLDEPDETVIVDITSVTNGSETVQQQVTAVIVDDDNEPSVQFLLGASAGAESTTPAQLAVTLSAASGRTVTVNYSVTGGTATGGGVDYTLAAGTLTFAPGVTSQTVDIAIVNDGVDEAAETIDVTLAAPSNATLGAPAAHTYTINDDDAAPTVGFSVGSSSGDEGTTPGQLTVTLSSASGQTVTVNYAATGGTATPGGVDYTLAGGTLTFAPGVTSQTIDITIVDDLIDEVDETVVVTLSGETNATLGTASHTYTILDNDNAPTLSIDDVTVTEGDSAVFTVTLTGATAQAVSVNFTTANGSAVVVGDYVSNSGTLNFPAGTLTQTITVVTVEDGVNEASENFFVNLSVPVNATISDNQGIGTITDDDAAPTLSIDDVTVTEGDSAVFTVTLTGATAQAVSVNFTTADGSAVVVGDYVSNSGTLNFPAGTLTQTITVVTVEDGVNEASENFFVNLSVPVNATISDNQGIGTITDDDNAPTLSIDDVTVTEGDSAVFTVTLTGATAQAVSVNFTTADGSAVVVGDYVSNSGTLNFPAGTLTQTITVVTVEDGVNEASENFFVNLSVPVNATISDNQGIGTISDDDAAPTLSIDDVTVTEGDSAVFTVTLTGATAQAVSVNFTTADGSAVVVGDYVANSGTLNFPAGTLTQTITVVTVEDGVNEASENFFVNLTVPVNATISDNQGVGTITDDDAAPTLSINDVTVTEGDSAVFTVTLTGATAQAVSVNFATANGSAVVVGDYVANSGTLNFPAGTLTQTITVVTVEDGVNEGSENFFVNLSVPVNATISDNQGIGTITDDDAAPTVGFALAASSGDEGTTPAQLTVSLSSVSAQTVTVNYGVTGGTAIGGGVDYTLASGMLTFAPGVTSQTIDITIIEDLIDEANETIMVTLSGETNATLGTASHTYTIIDNDNAPVITIGNASATEGGALSFTVTVTGSTSQVVTVDYATADGSAVAPGDYGNVGTTTLTFNPGDPQTQSITVSTVDDAIDEPSENMFVNLTNAGNATIGDNQGEGTINDNDNAPVLTINDVTVSEGDSAVFTVTLTGATSQDVSVSFTTADGTAVVVDDYTVNSGTLDFPAGTTTQTITVLTTEDLVNEATESFFVNLSAAVNATISDAQGEGTINDDDGVPSVTLSLAGSPLAEDGGVATVTATLSGVSGLDVTVNLALSGTASGADYSASGSSIVIPAGSLTGTITLTGVADAIDEADETIVVDISTVVNATESGTQQVVATITDEDGAPSVTLSLTGSPLAEDGGVATVTATLGAVSGLDVTVNLAFSGTASGADYSASGSSISIPAGSLTGSITLTGTADAIDEADETVIVEISSTTNATEVTPQQVTATITDQDSAPLVTLSLTGSPLAENGGVATVTATLGAVSGLDVTVNLALSGTASGADFTVSGLSISIPAGSLTGSITLTGVDDAIDESDETIIVDISSVVNATESGTQQVTATITDDEGEPVVTLSLTGSPLAEDGGVATVTATLSALSGQDVTVNLAFAGTASGADYTASASSISIPAGSLTGTITLTGVADAIDEADETIVVDISTVVNATESGTQQVVATITDEDGAPSVTLSLAGSPLAEDGGVATVTATLGAVSGLDVTVNLAFSGTASGADYTASNVSISIPAGNLTGTITLTGVADAIDEADETVIVDISSATNATEVTPQQVTATITDQDSAPLVTLSLTGSPLAENGGVATVTATLGAVSGLDVTVNLALSGTASGADFTASGLSISIPAGSLTGSITLTGVDDVTDEADETIIVDISSVVNGTESGTQQVTATITDDEGAPVVTLSLTGSPLAEDGGVATVTATLSALSGQDVTVNLAFAGTASGADYTASASSISIPAGSLTGTITLTGVADAIDEADETIVVDISTVSNATESGTQQVVATITDEDSAPSVTLSLTGSPLAEDGGVATVTATLGAVSGLDVTVNLAFSGTASGADYAASGLSISIPAGSLTGSITLTGTADAIDEADETVIVDISSTTNATEVTPQQVTATITDQDSAPSVTLSLTGSPLAENGGVATVTATLSGESAFDVTVNLALSGSAILDTDFSVSGQTIVIAAGSLSGSIAITAIQDTISEGDETVVVDIDSVINGTESTPQQVTATITDDEAVPSISVSDASLLEGDSGSAMMQFTVTLSGASSQDVTVNYQTSGVTATAGSDYTEAGASLTITAGQLSGTVDVAILGDELAEGDETFTLGLSGAVNATIGDATATGTITDDDSAPVAVADGYSVDEDGTLTVPANGVLGSDSDADGDSLSATRVSGPANGSLTLNLDGSFVYTPSPDFNGTDSFTYTVSDGFNTSSAATVTITVNAVNDAPSAVADSYTTAENVALTVAAPGVLTNDSDVDGDTLSAVKLSDPANGTVTLNADGSFVYTPNPNFFGADSFTYAANDGSVNSNEVTVSLTVTDAQDDPTLTSVAPGSICEGGPEFTLTVSGANFVSGAVVEWNGNARATSFVSATQLTAIIPASDIAEAGNAFVTVTNPAGGGSSNVMNFTVGEDTVAPTVTAPAQIFILQTECQAGEGGITTATSTLLADFLASATAADACSTEVDQLTPQLNGVDIDASTFLGGGDNLITFRFVDNAGNVGSADANVRVVLYGDMNEDGSVDATDLVIMANHLVGNIPMGTAPFTAPMQLIDLDANSSLDAVDLVTTAHYLVGNISCLPYASGQ